MQAPGREDKGHSTPVSGVVGAAIEETTAVLSIRIAATSSSVQAGLRRTSGAGAAVEKRVGKCADREENTNGRLRGTL